MRRDDDMSNTFVSEVGQKSAVFKQNDDIETLEEESVSFPDVKIDPPKEMPNVLKEENSTLNNKNDNSLSSPEEDDEEFLEAKKKKKSKKYKKRNPFVMFLVIIICLALGAGGSYYYFEVLNKNIIVEETSTTKKEVEEENKTEEVQPSSRFIKQLIEKYDSINYSIDTYSKLYSKDKILSSDLDAVYAQQLAILNIRHDVSFSKVALQESLDQLFGVNTFTAQTEDIYLNKCHKYVYANDYYTKEVGDECDGATLYSMQRKIVKAIKNNEDNKLYIDVAVAVNDGNKVYKGYDGANGIDELSDVVYASFDIEKDYTKLNQYKYSFNYDQENNDYYLEGIELVK